MKAINTLLYSSSSSSSSFAHNFYFTSNLPKFPQSSFSTKRRRSRRSRTTTTHSPSDIKKRPLLSNDSDFSGGSNQSLKLVLDVNQITTLTSSKLTHLLSLAEDAYYDLKTVITLDENNRVVFSCRKSTVHFTGGVILAGFVLISAIRVLTKLGLGFRSWLFRVNKNRNTNVVVRRDRSLGGKEVVVARRDVDEERPNDVKRKRFGVLDSPMENSGWVFGSGLGSDDWRRFRVRSGSKLPKWWPESAAAEEYSDVVDKQEYQRDANRLVRAITDYRTSGKDVSEHDIIQLRQICRACGVQVSFDTTNTRDAFYRASVDYVLNVCSRESSYSNSIQIDGEDAKKFVAGLAGNIGLEKIRAARMVSAAVAARTRSCFLQAWALEAQGKHSEAAQELSKICLVLQTFPPDEASPEMEMVARGLGKNLKLEHRELLMNMFSSVCSKESHRSAADALGLMPPPIRAGEEQESSKAA